MSRISSVNLPSRKNVKTVLGCTVFMMNPPLLLRFEWILVNDLDIVLVNDLQEGVEVRDRGIGGIDLKHDFVASLRFELNTIDVAGSFNTPFDQGG